MSTERLISGYDHSAISSSHSLHHGGEEAAHARIFDELPTATIVSVVRPDARDITPLLLSYTIELQYKQVVRSVSQWSGGTNQTEDSIHRAYCSLIEKAKHFICIENQFFISGLSEDEAIQNRVLESLYNCILRAHREKRCFRVIIVIPLLPGFQGGVDDGGAATVRAIMHWQYRTICRGRISILQKLCAKLGPVAHDFISFFGLRTYGRLLDGGPLVTSQVYVHSKVMIVDDRCALIGSSYINDRSLLGSRDSEIAVVIEDKEFVDSSMDGNPWNAGKFAFSLRLSLWAEHLGLNTEEIDQIKDPIAETAYKFSGWTLPSQIQRSIRMYSPASPMTPSSPDLHLDKV